jgi:hypothetical protein
VRHDVRVSRPARLPGLRAPRLGVPARRPGPLGALLLVPTWVLLGAALVAYVVAVLALAFAAVLVATLRLVLTPPLTRVARGAAARRRTASAGP